MGMKWGPAPKKLTGRWLVQPRGWAREGYVNLRRLGTRGQVLKATHANCEILSLDRVRELLVTAEPRRVDVQSKLQRWGLQIRGPEELANGREGKAFVVAHADLSRGELLELRDAILAAIGEA
jgi:hypothetical protein